MRQAVWLHPPNGKIPELKGRHNIKDSRKSAKAAHPEYPSSRTAPPILLQCGTRPLSQVLTDPQYSCQFGECGAMAFKCSDK
jgi:hypothetical protein